MDGSALLERLEDYLERHDYQNVQVYGITAPAFINNLEVKHERNRPNVTGRCRSRAGFRERTESATITNSPDSEIYLNLHWGFQDLGARDLQRYTRLFPQAISNAEKDLKDPGKDRQLAGRMVEVLSHELAHALANYCNLTPRDPMKEEGVAVLYGKIGRAYAEGLEGAGALEAAKWDLREHYNSLFDAWERGAVETADFAEERAYLIAAAGACNAALESGMEPEDLLFGRYMQTGPEYGTFATNDFK